MYERFFGLDESPFRLTPDPRYLFLSDKHREALGHLVYGIREGAGFVAITGEIGAGKTTLLRAFMAEPEENVRYAYILNPVLTGVELLQEINHELGLPHEGTQRELLSALNQFLLEQKRLGRQVALVIDEAQTLGGVVLEQLRMLSNFETNTAKLLQIVLVGQPELRDLLKRADLRQLDQRITVRWHLGPLDRDETAQYIAHRLATASGGKPRRIFTRGALARIHSFSNGLPRLINIVCHRALLVAYARDRSMVNWRTVGQAIREIERPRQTPATPSRVAWSRYALAAGVVAVLAAAAAGAWQQGLLPPLEVARVQRAADATPPAEPAKEEPLAAVSQAQREPASEPPAAPVFAKDEPRVAAAPLVPPTFEEASLEPEPAVESSASEQAPAAALSDPHWVERMALGEAARQTSASGSAYEAVEALLRAWDADALNPAEASNENIDLPSIAQRRGLAYLQFQGNLNVLKVLDLPAILELVPSDAEPRFALVDQLDDDRVRVTVGRTTLDLPESVFSDVWFGQGHLLWDDVNDLGPLIAMGSSGPSVGRLHEMLRTVGTYQGPGGSVFSTRTQEAVQDFQRSVRLSPDGKVGPMTMIALYQRVVPDRLPHLVAVESEDRSVEEGGRLSALAGGGG